MSINNKQKHFILLRGLSREARHWHHFQEELIVLDSAVKCHYIEYPGSGRRYKEIFPIKTQDLLEDINSQIQSIININQGDFYIISISLGGMVVLKYLETFERLANIKKIFLINTSTSDVAPFYWRFQFKIWSKALKVVFSKDEEVKERLILDFTTNLVSTNKKQEISRVYASYAKVFTLSLTNLLRQLLWAAKATSPKKIMTPILFLTSKKDKLCYYKCSQRLALKYNQEILYHDKAGHDLPLDDGKWLAKQIYFKS